MTDYARCARKAGLSAKAAAVYTIMLQAGTPLSPKAIITQSQLHRQYVYNALKDLEERRLLITEKAGKRVRYSAASPDALLQDIEQRRLETLDGVTALMKLYDRSPAGIVEVVRGSQTTIEHELQLLKEARHGDFLDIIGGAGMHWVRLYEHRVIEWEQLRRKKGIRLRYIGGGEDVRYNKEESIVEHESRMIPGIGDIVNVSIRPESVSFNIFEPEIVTVHVKNKEAVESQRALFEVLWKIAR